MKKNPDPLAETLSGASCATMIVTPYVLLINDDQHRPHHNKSQTVITTAIEDAADFMHLLGSTCTPLLSSDYRQAHPGHYERLMDAGSCYQDKTAPFDIDRAATLLKKIPFDLKSLIRSHIALRLEDTAPTLIRKELVHKTSQSNILISEPFSVGNLHYFNMFLNTSELVFDHSSDHVQGMLILEALRQAGIATAHLQGLPLTGKLALLHYNTSFYSFLETESPIILRSFSNFSVNENSEFKDYYVTIQAVQWGKVCTETIIRSLAYMNSCQTDKINKKLEKIALRNKNNFEATILRNLETESTNQCA